MIDRIAANSRAQGYNKSRLPEFTLSDIKRIRGTSDFFGINTYTTFRVTRNDLQNSGKHPIPSFHHDMGVIEDVDPEWPTSGSEWLHVSKYLNIKLLFNTV